MDDWKTFVDKIKELLKSQNLSTAKEELALGLNKLPNQFNLLTIATNVYRSSGDHEKSLRYAELLITHHPDKRNGYGSAAQELVVLKRFEEAQVKIQEGLEKLPNQFNLLTIATNVYRSSGDHEKSLRYAELLITHHPDKWHGYGISAQELVVLKRFEEAQAKIQEGLNKLPNQFNLLTIATNVYRSSGDHEKSLKYAELLITHHPDKWHGYNKLVRYLTQEEKYHEANITIEDGLRKNFDDPTHLQKFSLLMWQLGNTKKALDLANKSLLVNPVEVSTNLIIFDILLSSGETSKASDLLNQFLQKKINVESSFYISISDSLRLSGDRLGALEISKKLVCDFPDHEQSYARLAQDLFLSGSAEEAQSLINDNYKNISHYNLLPTGYHILCACRNFKLADKIFQEMMERSKSYFNVKNQTNKIQIIKNLLPSKEHAKNNNYVNLVESAYGSNQKVELTIVAGCSGSGKSTLLNMHKNKLTQIDPEEKIILERPLPVNAISELNKLEIHMNNLCQDRYHRALTLGGYFDFVDLTSLIKEKIFPSKMLMHIDLKHILLCLKGSHLNPRKSIDLIDKNENDMIMRQILKNPFFQNCKSIKVLTLWIDYEENKIRFYKRSKVRKFFQLRDITSNYVHSELYNCWFRNLHYLNPSSDHLITELDGNYSVIPR